jgi:hypothetical protein
VIEGFRLTDLKGDPARRALLGNKRVRIWSGEWGMYWRPNYSGYTRDGLEAGVFDFDEAWLHTSHCGPEKRIEFRIVQEPCPLCHGTGKRVPSYVNLSDPCPCQNK